MRLQNLSKIRRWQADKFYMDVSSIALQGLQQAQLQLQNVAANVATLGGATLGGAPPNGANVDTVNLSQQAVSMIGAKTQFSANINILKVEDNMQKNLLNVLG